MAAKKTTKKTTKATTPKTTATKQQDVKSSPVKERKLPEFKLEKKTISILIGIAVIILVLYLLRSVFIAGMVNGQPVFRITVVKELEKQGGKQVMENLVIRDLIVQEARKRNVTVTDEDIKNDLNKIEESYKSQGQTLDEVLKLYGLTREEVIEQRRPWILLEKMLANDTKVTADEVEKYMTDNADLVGQDASPEDVKKDLEAQKLQQKQQEFIENLQKQAKVVYFVNY